MPEQGQTTGAVVGHGKHQCFPGDVTTRLIRFSEALGESHRTTLCVLQHLVSGHLTESALGIFLLITAMTQRNNQNT